MKMRSFERLLAFASRWFDPATVSGVFEPLVADWQREWLAAAPSRRRLIMMRGYAAFVVTAIVSVPRLALAPIPASLTRRIAIRVGLFSLVGMGVQISFYLWDPVRYHEASLIVPLRSWPYLIPTLLTVALPFAMLSGVRVIRRWEESPRHIECRAVVKLVLAATLWTSIGGGWLAPYANQRWRLAVFSANPQYQGLVLRGARELSTVELFTTDDRAFPLIRPGERVQEISFRLSWIVLPLLLASIRWQMFALQQRRSRQR